MSRKGFSLIEVNMAIFIAAAGLLSLFTLFPAGLRQSEMSSEDLYQSTYATSILQMIAGNIATIDDVDVWNDTEKDFWAIAVEGTDLPKKLQKSSQALRTSNFDREILDQYLDFTEGGARNVEDNVWYTGSEFSGSTKSDSLPEQYLIRVFRKGNTMPNVYVVSVVCSSIKPPAIYYQNSVYSMEFAFYGKTWSAGPQ
ncbi:MAG: hypothetical protein J6V41_00505 [Kiritimatiellae bacterium]|nr:hypothetical protein [Kiritimatiellia bacterium]